MGERAILWNAGCTFAGSLATSKALCSRSDAEQYFAESSSLQNIIILAELQWDGRKLSDFYGFEILCKLRMEYRLMCPIVVCSFMFKESLSKRFPIISDFSASHTYVRLPASKYAIIRKVHDGTWLDEPRLNHVIINCCDPLTRIHRHLTHGKGFHIIFNGARGELPRSFLSDCGSDLNVLANYLKCPLFDDEELTSVNAFMANLSLSLKAGDADAVLGMRDSLRKLVRILARGND